MWRDSKTLKYEQTEQNHRPGEKKSPRVCSLPVLWDEDWESQWGTHQFARWACSGMVYGFKARQKKAQKKKRRIGFNVSFQPAKLPSWTSWQSLKKSQSCWFLQACYQRWYEERAPLSLAVNPMDSRWATERHLQDIWYCIFPLSLWAQVHHHYHALAEL